MNNMFVTSLYETGLAMACSHIFDKWRVGTMPSHTRISHQALKEDVVIGTKEGQIQTLFLVVFELFNSDLQ